LPIYQPHKFFAAPSGVCVDLSRFAVETLRHIDPDARASYLMIEFAPVTIGGNTLRRHWLASFTRDGKYYFFADSKRPGHIAGPCRYGLFYSDVEEQCPTTMSCNPVFRTGRPARSNTMQRSKTYDPELQRTGKNLCFLPFAAL
jgi:hypothetical protein